MKFIDWIDDIIVSDDEGINLRIRNPDSSCRWEIDIYGRKLRFFVVGDNTKACHVTEDGDYEDAYGNTMRNLKSMIDDINSRI